MREVDVLMMESAFETKTGQTCIPYNDVDGECKNGMDYFIHLNIESDVKTTHIACPLSNDTEQLFHVKGLTPTETFDSDDEKLWKGITNQTYFKISIILLILLLLWKGSTKRLRKFFKDSREDGFNKNRDKQRQNTALVSTAKKGTFRLRSAGQTPNPKRQKGDDGGSDEEYDDATPRDDTAPPSELFPDATRTSSPHLQQSLFDEHGNINESTTTHLIAGLESKYKKKGDLTPGEKRLLGCLAQIDMTATTRGDDGMSSITDIPSFPRVDKFTLVRQPIQYLHDKDPNPRTLRPHTRIVQALLGVLAGSSFALAFLIDLMRSLGDVAKRQVSKAAGCCCSPGGTVVFQSYCNLNGEQMNRIKKFTLKWVWRMFSSWSGVAEVKEDCSNSNCKTAQSKTVFFRRCKEAADASDSEDDSPQGNDDRSSANHNDMMMCNTGPANCVDDDRAIKDSALVKTIGARSKGSADEGNDSEAAHIHPQTPRTHDCSFSSYETRSLSYSITDNYEDHAFEVSSFQSIEVDEGDDDCSLIGTIDIMPISPSLSLQERNIRMNAYNLLMRLGEEVPMFDLNSNGEIETVREREECDSYCDGRLQPKKQQQEVASLKRQLGECKDMVEQLYANLRSYSNYATNDDDVASVGINNDDDHKDDDIMAELHSEIINLTNQLQSATLQSRLLVHESMIGFPSLAIDEVDESIGNR